MFDAIVVGARCAGSPTAMLLARLGYRVLLVDRATFPSDTISTHWIWQLGLASLKRWGLLDRVLATNCPLIPRIGLDLGTFQLAGDLLPADGIAAACVPRRTVLDKILVDAAAASGAEVREGFSATGLTWSDGRVTGIRGHERGGGEIEERARIVVGADAEYNVRPALTCGYYAYWSVPPHLPAIHPQPRRVVITFPTNDGVTVTYVAWPCEDFDKIRSDLDWNILDALDRIPDFKDMFHPGARAGQVMGMRDFPNFLRKPYGDGWALVGDAGYHKDPIIAQGISDAFRSAEWLAQAVHAGLSGAEPMIEALAKYQRVRDEHLTPMYDLSCSLAGLEPPSPEMQALYEALRTNEVERNRFFGTLGGIVPVAEYYAPENMQRIVAGAS
ncbi:MAG: NAD(P)/FAD-dependent oxidoreductase [Alphaproteobacteria bacterium]|nr:NAD(P)/FAD-dependent oxidoreductase [Alphaproteobacteria bacterium]